MSAAAGAGPSSAVSALSAAAAALVPLGSVFVKRSDDPDATFAEVTIHEGDTVARLAKNASRELEWGIIASHVKLFLVREGGEDEPTEAAVSAAVAPPHVRLQVGYPLPRARIGPGSWVVAVLSVPPAAAPGESAAGGGAGASAEGAKRSRTVAFIDAPPPGVVITVRDLEASHKSFDMAVPASWDEFLELLRQMDNYVDTFRLYYHSAGSAPTKKKLACAADFVAYYATLRMAGRLPDIWVLRAAEMPSPEQLYATEVAAAGAGGGAGGGVRGSASTSNRSSTQQSGFRNALIRRDASGSADAHCSLCGQLGEVEAAHIMPQKRTDQFTRAGGLEAAMTAAGLVDLYDPRNGFLLCTSCHGFFDSYLWSVDSEGKVELSDALAANVPSLAVCAGTVPFPDSADVPLVERLNRPLPGVFAWHYQAYQMTTAARHGKVALELFDCSRCKQRFSQEWRKNKHEPSCSAVKVSKSNFYTPAGKAGRDADGDGDGDAAAGGGGSGAGAGGT